MYILNDEYIWLKPLIDRVKIDLDELCPVFEVRDLCGIVLESIAEVDPLWFEGKKSKTLSSAILYIAILLSKGLRRGYLKKILEATGASKPTVREAISRFAIVDWEDDIVYLNPKFYTTISRKIKLPEYVVPYIPKEVVKIKLRKATPGLYEYFDLQCVKDVGKDCVSLLFENPAIFRDIVLKRYEVPVVAKRIVERFLTPIVKTLDIDETPRELAELLLKNPEKFKNIISSYKFPKKKKSSEVE